MCAIYGFIGRSDSIDWKKVSRLQSNASDRGRDGGNEQFYSLGKGRVAGLGNWRATPTPERQRAPLQPYDGVVHNGTIANDKELGARKGEVDSMVLPRILDRGSLDGFAESLAAIKGSYAIAAITDQTIYLACNYKPLHYWRDVDGTTYFASMERHFDGVCHAFNWQRPCKLAPYSAMDLSTGETVMLPRDFNKSAVVICSTGLDSTTVATKFVRDGWRVRLLHFRYGCAAEPREVERVRRIGSALGCAHAFLSFDYKQFDAHSTLFGHGRIGGAIEGAEFAIDWVPARNLIMLAMAAGFAESNDYHAIALGNNLEEAGAYPDNEEEFTHLFDQLMPYAVRDGYQVNVLSPVGHLMKHEIVRLGLQLNAPFEHTWSCYRAGDEPCGECGPCFMRREAFRRNNVVDPTATDKQSDYWKNCICYSLLAPNAAEQVSPPTMSVDAVTRSLGMTTP